MEYRVVGLLMFLIAVVTALFTIMAFTTHASHMRDLKYSHEEMTQCISTNRTADECRRFVYGEAANN